MAIAREGTATSNWVSSTATETDPTHSHTTSASTSLLLVAIGLPADNSDNVVAVTYDSVSLTLIAESTSSLDLSDRYIAVYGLISPGSKTADVVLDTDSAVFGCIASHNYSGTNTDSVAAATNSLETDEDDSGVTNSKAFSSQGTSGHTMVGGFCIRGTDNQDPIAVDNSFSDVIEPGAGEAGESNSNVMLIADKIAGAPSAVTFTGSGTNDEWAAFLIELVPAAVTGTRRYRISSY
jgi:hypothetical protein